MDIKRNYLFFIDKEGTKDSGYKPDGKLRFRIRYSIGKVDFNVGYRVELTKWSTDTQRCKVGTTHSKKKISATDINKEIQRLENLADKVFKSFEIIDKLPIVNEFREAFNNANNNELERGGLNYSFFYLFNEFVKERGRKNDWTKSTYEKFSSVKKHLLGFDQNIRFDDWDEIKLTDYVDYLRTEKK